MRQMWVQQFYAPSADDTVKLRTVKDTPPSTITIHSPYDIEAHYSSKRSVNWVGYKVHMTEICDDDSPRLITAVHTTLSTITDEQAVEPIHEVLEERELLPEEHFLDSGYPTSENLVTNKTQYDVEIIAPVRIDPSWQTKAQQGFDSSKFQIDWDNEKVTCPQGHQSTKWLEGLDVSGKPLIRVRFSGSVCRACPVRLSCTKSKTEPRELTLLPQAQQIALQARRQEQLTPEWKTKYNQRAGIESTHSQAIRRLSLRRSRYIGLNKTHLMHVFIACALNLIRLDAWLNGVPLAQTRSSRFKQLQPQGA